MKKTPILNIPLFGSIYATPAATNHPTGDAFFKNQIATVSPQYDADVKTGRALALGATNDLAIPIHHTLGADTSNHLMGVGTITGIVISDNLDGSYNITGTAAGTSAYLEFTDLNQSSSVESVVEFECVISNGSATFAKYYDGTSVTSMEPPHQIVNGTNRVQCKNRPSRGAFLYLNDGDTIDMDITPTSIKQITSMANSFLTYHDIANDEIIQIDNSLNPPTTEYILNDVTLNNILTHQMPFSEGDLNLIQQEPNLLAALALGEVTPISSVTLDADDSWYACSEESGADVFDARVAGNDTTISGDLTSVRITNQQKGLQTTALLLDANGVPESYNSTANTARVYDDTIISTGFKPSIARFSIEESVSGNLADLDVNGDPTGSFTQRTEKRLLTHTDAKLGTDSKKSATTIPSGVVES